jgi:type I restriction enzyme R subunit
LLETLKREKLMLDWRKKQQAKAAVQVTIDDMLDRLLPLSYSKEVYLQLCIDVFSMCMSAIMGKARVCMSWRVEL